MIYIYTLSHPISLEIRYVGKTKFSLQERLSKHLCTRENNHRGNWIRSLLKQGLKPTIKLLDEVEVLDWKIMEIYWISQMKTWGFNLVNATKGGDSGIMTIKCIEAAKLKNTNSRRTEEQIIKLRLNSQNKKSLVGIKNGEIFKFVSASEAARITNSNLSHITEVCNGLRKTHNGYKWKYQK